VFKSPVIEPSQMPNLYFQLDMMHNNKVLLGVVRVPTADLCNRDRPFHNMWVPLSSADPETGELAPNLSGEVHIMTLWVQSQQTGRAKRLPKTARGWLMHGLRMKLQQPSLRDPVYEHEVHKAGYNPNCAGGEWPKKHFEASAEHVEAMAEVVPYLDCCEKQNVSMWAGFRARHRARLLQEMGGEEEGEDAVPQQDPEERLGQWRRLWAGSKPPKAELLHELDELLRRGVPPGYRRHLWQQITYADLAQESVQGEMGSFVADPQRAVRAYRALVDFGRPYRNDAVLQLQEDLVGAAGWEAATANPLALERHLTRLRRAEDVCIALIVFSMDYTDIEKTEPPMHYSRSFPGHPSGVQPCGVAYCESLLVLAFFLLLAQGKEETPSSVGGDGLARRASTSSVQRAQQEEEDEARTFWLLYTLIAHPDNMAYREYYGVPEEFRHEMHPDFAPMSDRRGAMDDVYRLGVCVARYERELWVHLGAIGLHLSIVFYRAFMHLFAFLLPTPSLFRFWDLLLSESARPDLPAYKPPRHSLVDLGFGVLRGCKQRLLQCQSASEARSCIVDFLESLYDPSAVVELATDMERYLWDDPLQKTAEQLAGITPMHITDYNRHVSYWEAHLLQFRVQNCVLRELARDNEVVIDVRSEASSKTTGTTNTNASVRQDADPRLTTRKAVNQVIPTLQKHCMAEGAERSKFGGMLRQTPLKLRELGPELDQSLLGAVSSWFSWATETMMPEDLSRPMAYGVPPPPHTAGEPTALDHVEFGRQVQRSVGTAWNSYIQRIYESFASPLERRLSLNEFFIALICCSKGTVGEKAMALFHLYASAQPSHRVPHIVPVTHNAATVVERIEGNARRTEGQLYKAPSEEEVRRSCALHFRVYTHGSGNTETLLGEAFVPNLGPYRWNGIGQDVPQAFSLWGIDKRLPPGVLPSNVALEEHGVRPCIGELSLAVKWIPSSEATPDVGQLGLQLHSVYLNPRNVEAPKWKNPRVSVVTYDEKGGERPVKRWDRSAGGSQRFTVDLGLGGAFGENLEWQETMYRDTFGMLHPRRLATGNVGHGWDPRQELWQWSQKWGDQYSVENLRMRKELVKGPSQRPNSISLRACRLIAEGILRRGLACVTNRQAVQISDQIFNRAGAVPGILDAVVVQGGSLPSEVKTIKQLRQLKGFKHVDVKHQIVLAYETQVSQGLGSINFFPPSQTGGGEPRSSLASIKIQDPFPGEPKMLWLRCVRAGDGQRFNEIFKVDGDGSFPVREVAMDMEMDVRGGNVQMALTKEEFVSCVLSHPVLSETLRRLSTTDNSNRRVPDGHPIKLDVAITDPTQEEAEEDFMDAMNVRQGVLLEVWDHDTVSKDDFLGECWLPPLSSIGPQPKQFVLPVRGAPPDQDGGSTRPDPKKRLDRIKCIGDLFLEASWTFPAQEVPEGGEEASLEERVKQEEALHTGRLQLKILKAEALRVADSKASDPYVRVYVRNETFGKSDTAQGLGAWGWHVSRLGSHETSFETKHCKATVNPEWNEECELQLVTGAFERRVRKHNGGARRQRREEHDAAVMSDGKELRIQFGPAEEGGSSRSSREPGRRHGVEVLLGDTVHGFRNKLRLACEREATAEEDPVRKGQLQACAEQMSARHAVMVFVPSPKLRELHQQQREKSYEYRKLYKIEEQDPSSWQPLDPIRTFNHYAAMYGFGHPQMSQRLRVAEGTEDFRLKNNRYRLFEQEQARWAQRGVEAKNTETQCFGFARLPHPLDGGSPEWRPALVERLEAGDGPRRFRARLLHAPLLAEAEAAGAEAAARELSEEQVLLAPPNPRILGSGHLEHQEFLAKAWQLHDEGLGEKDVVQALNDELKERWQKTREVEEHEGKAHTPAPPPITLSDVQFALRHGDPSLDRQALPAR